MDNPIVLDASAWLSFLLHEEGSDGIGILLEKHNLLAPSLIRHEAANGLLLAKRRKRLHRSVKIESLLNVVLEFPLQIIPESFWWKESLLIINKHKLTFYDAAYVGLAKALKVSLLTFDKEIRSILSYEKVGSVELSS